MKRSELFDRTRAALHQIDRFDELADGHRSREDLDAFVASPRVDPGCTPVDQRDELLLVRLRAAAVAIETTKTIIKSRQWSAAKLSTLDWQGMRDTLHAVAAVLQRYVNSAAA